MKVKVYRELNKPNSKGEASIILRCRIDGRKLSFSSGITINEKDWNPIKKVVRQTNDSATSYNHLLSKYEGEIIDVVTRSEIKGAQLSKDYIAQRLSFISSKQKAGNLKGYFDEFIEIKRVHLTDGTLKKFERMFHSLELICKRSKAPLAFASFNDLFFSRLVDYYYNERELTTTSVKEYQKKLTAFLNWCTDVGYNENLRYKKFRIQAEEPEIYPLNENEIELLENVELEPFDIRDKTRDIFLFQTYTGMRFSEALKVKPSHINNGVIRFNSQKVKGVKYIIPISERAKRIIDKYSQREELTEGYLLPRMKNQVVNRYLKEVGELASLDREISLVSFHGKERSEKKVKLYEQLSSHDARRTFITFCLSKGMNAQMIMRITGHRNYSTFERYVKFTDHDLSKSIKFVWD